MALRLRPRPFMKRHAYAGLALGALTVVAAGRPPRPPPVVAAPFLVRYRDVVSPDRVRALTVLPGETVKFEVVARGSESGYLARPAESIANMTPATTAPVAMPMRTCRAWSLRSLKRSSASTISSARCAARAA